MDRYSDFYGQGEVNYRRLFLLFVLFLVSLFYYMGDSSSNFVQAGYIETASSLDGYQEQVEYLLK